MQRFDAQTTKSRCNLTGLMYAGEWTSAPAALQCPSLTFAAAAMYFCSWRWDLQQPHGASYMCSAAAWWQYDFVDPLSVVWPAIYRAQWLFGYSDKGGRTAEAWPLRQRQRARMRGTRRSWPRGRFCSGDVGLIPSNAFISLTGDYSIN